MYVRSLCVCILRSVCLQIAVWYRAVDQSDNYVTEQFCRSILEPCRRIRSLFKSDHIRVPGSIPAGTRSPSTHPLPLAVVINYCLYGCRT